MYDIEFILGLGKAFSLVIAMVFIEGIVSSKPGKKATYWGLVLPVVMTGLSFIVYFASKLFAYFCFLIVPTILCWFIFFMCQRAVRNGTALSLQLEDEEDEDLHRNKY